LNEQDLPCEPNIKELIVVEGQNDAHAVRRALGNVDIIWTEGFGLTEEKLDFILEISKKRGVIICTDPDFPGKQIRARIARRVPEAKHVYLSRSCAFNPQNGDIGLENASSAEIRKAFSKILEVKAEEIPEINTCKDLFLMKDLLDWGLAGQEGAAARRSALGKILGIGDTNAKQFLYRLNRYAFSREDLQAALKILAKEET
jgi:ribonuclease M5